MFFFLILIQAKFHLFRLRLSLVLKFLSKAMELRVVLLTIFSFSFCLSVKVEESDGLLDLIRDVGYKAEAHQVETEDGYLLKIHRILPNSKKSSAKKKPVFLMHGVLTTAADFVVTGPEIALGYLLADHGYDVWLGNARGSLHSMIHRNYSVETKEFWAFSWHEIGFYDLPVMIDYVLNVTKARQTFYVGYSQGTTALLVLLSSRPEYNQKIARGHLMATAAFVYYAPHPRLRRFGQRVENGFLDEYRFANFEPVWSTTKLLGRYFCNSKRKLTSNQCQSVVFTLAAFFGSNHEEVEIDTVSVLKLTRLTLLSII
jgi:lysosomal acid lipase/cholesteryl ester hydrolase